MDVALDSAGFVAMARYGGYRWSVAQYVELAGLFGWTWWAQMDLCCEPKVATDRQAVLERVHGTAGYLLACRAQVDAWEAQGCDWLTHPMPVLQGWRPEDYERSAALADTVLDGEWPSLVGVGSVCKRHEGGPDGLWAILRHLDAVLPPHVRLHLFGAKGNALPALARWGRVASTDSMAWDFGARYDRKHRASSTVERVAAMERWWRSATAACGGGTWSD